MAFVIRNSMEISAGLTVLISCLFLLSNGAEIEDCCQTNNNRQSFTTISKQPYRTSYHFQPSRNWINGVYLSSQILMYNPHGAVFGDIMIWAHSASYDLINWFHLNHAICPSEPYDINSCWSGSTTYILYTGIDANGRQVQNLAMPKNLSDPLLKEWVKFSGNPIMTPPNGVKVDNFRDPTTAWLGSDGEWRVIIGSQSNNQGMVILYRSKDFVHWTKFQHPLYSSERTGMWECPDFYPVSINGTNGVDTSILNPSVKHVVKTSFNSHDYYVLGTYDPQMEKFFPDSEFEGTSLDLRYDYGKFYASKTFFDSVKNRRILWAWVNESDSIQNDIEKGWSGVQSIPRQIWLDESGKQLVQWPVEEVEMLRGKQASINNKKLESGSVFEVSGIIASQVDVEVVFELPELEKADEFTSPGWVDPQLLCNDKNALIRSKLGPFSLLALATEDLTEQTAIFFRIFRGHNRYIVLMCSDQSRSSLREDTDKTTYGAFVDIDPLQVKISLRSLIDHSMIESFGGGGRTCITSRVYPRLATKRGARLCIFNNGTLSVVVSSMNAWSMNKALTGGEEGFKI
uniref:Beta-fructofuranosidase, insoluble isoenzyme CWINV1 n=1 Tax=Litchi chinensis TaxID=151069 RepID=A0A248XBG7_LITCN|nr:beta-fructofuranosidase, insoluble isoenzyme CWINV1 [Litchi chinensis]